MNYRTQDLIFTLYGDYITPRGGEVWIGHIIELMAGLDTSAQAVRSTLSRMMGKGWLRSRREGRHSFYAITPRAKTLLSEGTRRIYQPRQDPWDGRWYILTYTIPEGQRHLRHRLRQRLTWLGFGRLGPARNLQADVDRIAASLGIPDQIDCFVGEYLGFSQARALVERCWDLQQLNRAYLAFINRHRPAWRQFVSRPASSTPDPKETFTCRFLLVHEYRSFPYVDPNLPPELLPNDWLGNEAIHLFQTYAALLAPHANAYVDQVLSALPGD
ncbi:MAG: PaaX family transcriptional regulator C-terminal domain-containing protein [Anaerolineae bacterium]